MHIYREIEQWYSSMMSFSGQACLLQLYAIHLTAFHEIKAAFCVCVPAATTGIAGDLICVLAAWRQETLQRCRTWKDGDRDTCSNNLRQRDCKKKSHSSEAKSSTYNQFNTTNHHYPASISTPRWLAFSASCLLQLADDATAHLRQSKARDAGESS